MKQFKTDIIILIGLLVFAMMLFGFIIGQSSVDIRRHDTYLVVDKKHLTMLIVGLLTFLIFLARGLIRNFKTLATNFGLIIGLILVAMTTYYIIQIQQSYLSEILKLDNAEHPDLVQMSEDVKKGINLSWGLFSLWIIGILLLTIKSIKIYKNDQTG